MDEMIQRCLSVLPQEAKMRPKIRESSVNRFEGCNKSPVKRRKPRGLTLYPQTWCCRQLLGDVSCCNKKHCAMLQARAVVLLIVTVINHAFSNGQPGIVRQSIGNQCCTHVNII